MCVLSPDLLPRINPVGFLTLPGHSGRASLRGISAPVVHISFCVRAVIATAFCQDANITTAITCVLSLGKNLTYHAARFLVCTRDKYYTAIQQINVSINRQYGIHPTAKDRGLSACYDRKPTWEFLSHRTPSGLSREVDSLQGLLARLRYSYHLLQNPAYPLPSQIA